MGQKIRNLIGRMVGNDSGQEPGSRSSARWLAGVQCLFAVAAVAGLIAVPPASGRMLLVPMDAGGRDGLVRLAVGAGARLVDRGPFSGSMVVSGDRGTLMAALLPRHILVLRAGVGGCGDKSLRGKGRDI